jgi:glutaredoxin
MEGCPYCYDFKNMLKEEKIEFLDLDINKNEEEYSMFTQIVENDLVPAFMIVDDQNNNTVFMAPDRDFQDLDEAINLIKHTL